MVNPKIISNELHSGGSSANVLTSKGITHMTMQFGQFLDHDITLTAQTGKENNNYKH